MATPRTPLATARRITLVLAGVAGIAFAGLPVAQASPPATAGDAATLMAARAHDLEKVTEAFNAARDDLAAQQAAAQGAEATMQKARAAQAVAQQEVRGIARSAYTGQGGTFQALLTSNSAEDFIGQVTTLQKIAGHQTAVLDQAAAAGAQATQAQQKAAAALTKARATYQAVAGQQAQLQAQVNSFQADFNRLTAQEKQAAVAAAGGGAGSASRGVDRSAVAPTGPVVASSQAAQVAVDTALAQRGKPYVWAAAGPGSFDCSGLMQYAYKAAGVSLPHSSLAQSTMGKPVAKSALQPGDLVFFYTPVSHVGMYIGNGQFVQAPTAGDVVKVSSLDSMAGYVSARQLVG
jgi:cell wall-associated NlpC family hydrolase